MTIPVNRMKQAVADAERRTLESIVCRFVNYMFPQGRVAPHFRDSVYSNMVECGMSADWNDQAHIVRFQLPIDATMHEIRVTCNEAGEAMVNMLVQAGMVLK